MAKTAQRPPAPRALIELQINWRRTSDLTPYARNPRTHSAHQIAQIAASIERFGFTNPVLVDDAGGIIAGHGRVAAAKSLGLAEVPTLRLSHLTEAERRAYIIADNRLAETAGWDAEILAIELEALIELDFEIELTGFEIAEVDRLIEGRRDPTDSDAAADQVPEPPAGPPQTRPGDLWRLGRNWLLCGDAQVADNVARVMQGEAADLIFTDPPYNVPVDGHITGKGRHRHGEFAFASGEMDPVAFTAFLKETLGNAASICRDGAVAFVCMDWRHMGELLHAGGGVFTELKNLCVWNKTNAGMGTFYRSKHELVFVFKVGTAPHTNAFRLGETGRYRTNVWDYAGANTFGADRDQALSMHPTVKPVAMIADAIRDCTRRGERVLDVFGGSGSTLIAAERTGRRAHLLEFEPSYCDVILGRYLKLTGDIPVQAHTGRAFESKALLEAES